MPQFSKLNPCSAYINYKLGGKKHTLVFVLCLEKVRKSVETGAVPLPLTALNTGVMVF